MSQSSAGCIHAFEVATKSEIFVLPFHHFSNRANQHVCPHVQQVCPNVRPTLCIAAGAAATSQQQTDCCTADAQAIAMP